MESTSLTIIAITSTILGLCFMSLMGRMIRRADEAEGTADADPTPQGEELVTDPWDSDSYSLWPAPKPRPTERGYPGPMG